MKMINAESSFVCLLFPCHLLIYYTHRSALTVLNHGLHHASHTCPYSTERNICLISHQSNYFQCLPVSFFLEAEQTPVQSKSEPTSRSQKHDLCETRSKMQSIALGVRVGAYNSILELVLTPRSLSLLSILFHSSSSTLE